MQILDQRKEVNLISSLPLKNFLKIADNPISIKNYPHFEPYNPSQTSLQAYSPS